MTKLYGVSIINKHDVWLREDEENPNNWAMMSKEELERRLQRKMTSNEEIKGRVIIGYDDIVWQQFT